MSVLQGKNVVLGVTGGISAYKAAELCRLLRRAGATVRVVMTRAACEMITPLTLQTLSGNPVAREMFDASTESTIGHIRLADEADVVVVAPATADAIARFAGGLADDLLAAVVLATKAPVLLAPAMNVNMWEHPLTRANLRRLVETGRVATVGPDAGELACGWIGAGRLVDPAEIAAEVERVVDRTIPRAADRALAAGSGSLAGRRVVVTAGPTHEAIDAVRFLGNRSSGKMGFAMAAAAAARGAEVTLIAGPVSLASPPGVFRRVDVQSALQMKDALFAAADPDVVVMAAAVADFRPATRAAGKLSRRAQASLSLALEANPDLLQELARARNEGRPLLVGFAAEVGVQGDALVELARGKLARKGCDLIVANDVTAPGLGMGSDRNAVTMVFRDGRAEALEAAPKTVLAEQIWDRLLAVLPQAALPAPRRLRAT